MTEEQEALEFANEHFDYIKAVELMLNRRLTIQETLSVRDVAFLNGIVTLQELQEEIARVGNNLHEATRAYVNMLGETNAGGI